MSSDNSSPFVVSSKVPPIRHVRLIRNSSLPSLQSLISHPQSKKTYEPLSSQLSGRPKPALPNLPANPPIQNVNAIVAYDTFLDLEPLRVQNPPRLRKLTDSYRVSASDVRSKCLTDRTREEISSSITERYKPKIMEARRSAREIPKIANTFREKEMGRKNKSLNRIVTQSIDALPSVVDNENKKTEEDKEDNNNSTELNWESEKEEAVEIRNSTEEDQVTQDMSSMLGRRDTMKTPNGQVLRQALRKKSVEEDGLTQDMSSVFGRRDTMKTPNNQVLRQVYREKSADQAKCARCKKCEYCISCTKCSVLSQCMDCQTCPRCIKCPKCFEKDDLSPTREIKLRNVYFERYKGMEELERKDFLEKNPRDTYLKKCKDQRVLPFPLDLYNEEGKTGKKMEIKFYRLGNERANALASSIGINTDLENIDLTRIGLEGKGIAEILEKLTTNVKSLELTENKLDGVGLTALCMVITNRRYGNLRVLKLEGMGMGEKQGEVLANALIDNSFIKVLNLSRNRLGDRTMVNLAKFIEDSTTIQQLYLHWNNIMSKGCLLLCDSVVKSNTLKVLDVSWNRIGNHYNLSSAEKLAYMFRNNVSVVHLDFSFCGFREQECAIMAEGLLLNHTILGIHMTGNKWMTDDQGFMNRIVDNETSIIKDALWRRIPQHGEKVIHHPKSSKTTGNCWICEGWREVKFVWNTKEKEDADFEPVHIHLSFDNWKGHLMARESSTSWVLYKMCPPGNLQFFFSLRGGEKADLGNYNEAIEKLPESFKLHNAGQTKAPLTQNLKVPAVNMMCVDYFELLVSETLDLAIEKCVPRPKVEVLPVVEDTWRFAKSIFRYFRRDNLDLERRCFEFDFECSRISQIIRIEQELPGVKEELWKIYPKMRITYKYYSSLTPVGEIFSVPLNSYTEFITKTGVVDNKNLALHAIDKNFIATKSFGKNKFIRSPDKALVRYQFMEILVRCAIDKYYLSNCGCSYTEAVAKIVKEITPHCEEFNHEAFRLKRLWNPFCDFMFRSNISIMRRLYEKYCDHKRKLKGRNTMNLADFYKFCRDARLINVFLYEREPILIFNLAMMTQVDELNYGRHTRMFFVEFLDAFARLADKIIPTPDNPLPDLHDKIGELIKISAIKCLGEEDYHVFSPPDHLRALKIDLSPYPPKEK